MQRGVVTVAKATGHSFGAGALHLTLKLLGNAAVEIAVQAGTIFQHVNWVCRAPCVVSSLLFRLPSVNATSTTGGQADTARRTARRLPGLPSVNASQPAAKQ